MREREEKKREEDEEEEEKKGRKCQLCHVSVHMNNLAPTRQLFMNIYARNSH